MDKHISSILIVDDDPAGRETLEALLETQGYHLLLAENGLEALEKATQFLPDLILLDVMMPGIDGFEVCRRLRENPQLAEVPVLMITALDDDQSRLQGLQAGADDFISKPYRRAELRARVHTITRLNRYRMLIEERAKSTWIIDHAEEAYLLTDLDDRIRYANRRARLYFGLDEATYKGLSFVERARAGYQCEPAEYWEHWPPAQPCAKDHNCYLVQPESKTGHALWLQVNIYAADHLERLICLRDVTAHITTRRNMQTFHGMLQHKLRTPLEPLVSGLGFLVRSPTVNEKTRKEFIEMALHGAQQLNKEIGEILEFINADRLLATSEPIPLAELPARVREIAREQGLDTLTVALDPALQEKQVPLAWKNLEWILWELLANAKKFHPTQTPGVNMEFLAAPDPKQFRLRCSDNGLVLTPEQLAHAWTPYYQGEKYFTGQSPGMGLGLSTIANLVWQVGGQCHLYNRKPGPGVVAELTLPLYEE